MVPRKRRPFDATWLPFGIMIGFALGMGIFLPVTGNLLIAAGIGLLFGIVLGIVLGFRPRRRSGSHPHDREAGQPPPHDGH